MNKGLFLLKEMMRRLEPKTLLILSISVLLFAFLSGAMAVTSVLSEPEDSRLGVRFWVTPHEGLSQPAVEDLYRTLSSAVEVSRVRYIFSTAEAYSGAVDHLEVTLQPRISPESIMERVKGLTGVRAVMTPPQGSGSSLKALVEDPNGRGFWLAGAIIAFLACLLTTRFAFDSARKDFSGEIEMLELAGVNPRSVRLMFILLGGSLALLSALLTGVITFTATIWLPALSSFTGFFQDLNEARVMRQIAFRGVVLSALIAGAACILLGSLAYRYPRPLSRSRISSSSMAVKDG